MTHFNKIWEGNGYGHMNIYIINATIDSLPLEIGDEVGVFDGSKCVGCTVVTEDYMMKDKFVCNVIASMDDSTGNGFKTGNDIIIKLWDKSKQQESKVIGVHYHDNIDFWSLGKFNQNGSAFIDLFAANIYKKKLLLSSGSNILSIGLNPLSSELAIFFKSLIDSEMLLKVQNVYGESFENYNDWFDFIGSIKQHEDYNVFVKNDCELEYEGIL